jgi:hypothetical protein
MGRHEIALGRDDNVLPITSEHGAINSARSNPAHRFARFPDQIGLSADASTGDCSARKVPMARACPAAEIRRHFRPPDRLRRPLMSVFSK